MACRPHVLPDPKQAAVDPKSQFDLAGPLVEYACQTVFTMNANAITSAECIARIDNLDLEPIKYKLLFGEEALTSEEVHAAEDAYRNFLKLIAIYPEQLLVPNEDIDRFWHCHILDTRKYAADCDHIFGQFIHHWPYSGMFDAEDSARHASSASETASLYERHFGAKYLISGSCSSCGRACDGGGHAFPVPERTRPRPILVAEAT